MKSKNVKNTNIEKKELSKEEKLDILVMQEVEINSIIPKFRMLHRNLEVVSKEEQPKKLVKKPKKDNKGNK